MNREGLERLALDTVSADLYYDLADTIEVMTDAELHNLIKCDGNYKRELRA